MMENESFELFQYGRVGFGISMSESLSHYCIFSA